MPPARRSYFDHAATAALSPAARDAWLSAVEMVGNPSGLHASARRVKSLLEDARESIAADLGALPVEVVFTASASESDSIGVLSAWRARPERPAVVLSAVEHPGVATIVKHVEDARLVPVAADARVDVDALRGMVDERVGVVSVQLVNGEVGTLQPVAEVAEVARTVGAWSHTDAVQGLVHPGVDFAALGVDMASIAAHKIGGPVGIGALLLRRGMELPPAGLGSGQERGIVSGTPSAALAASFAAALREATTSRAAAVARLRELRTRLVAGVAGIDRVRVNGPADEALQMPGIVHLTIEGTRADDVLFLLDSHGVDASTGAACRAGLHQPSDVVLAMTGSTEDASSSVRLSFGEDMPDEDVDRVVALLPEVVERARTAHG